MGRMRVVLAGVVVCAGRAASAESPPDPPDPPEPAATEVTKESWPLADVERPLNVVKGMLELNPRFVVDYESTEGPTGVTESDTVYSLGIAGRYGVTEKIELLGAFDRLVLSPTPKDELGDDANGDRLKGRFAAGLGYTLVAGAKGGTLDAEAKGAFIYDVRDEILVVAAGVDVRYKLSDRLWVGTPVNVPGLVITLRGVDVGTTEIRPIALTIPAALGYQATPKLMVEAKTKLIRWNVNEDAQLLAASEAGADDKKASRSAVPISSTLDSRGSSRSTTRSTFASRSSTRRPTRATRSRSPLGSTTAGDLPR